MGPITDERSAVILGYWIDSEAGKRRHQLEISASDFWKDPLLAIAAKTLSFATEMVRWSLMPPQNKPLIDFPGLKGIPEPRSSKNSLAAS